MKINVTRSGLLAVILAGATGLAQAALEKVSFQGVVTANNPLVGNPAIGSSISGSYTIDSAILGGDGPNCGGTPRTPLCWSGPASSWTWNDITVTPESALLPFYFGIRYAIQDSVPGAGTDSLTIELNGLDYFTSVDLVLSDPTGGAFEGLVGFSSSTFSFVPWCTAHYCDINPSYSGTLTSFSVAAVPEPSAAALLLAGGLGLLAWRRR